jgi:hypothetical protein
LGLVAPVNLHLATACVQVVALAGAAKAKAMRAATVVNRRMNGIPSESLTPGRWLDKPVVWSGCSSLPILVALPAAARAATASHEHEVATDDLRRQHHRRKDTR